MFGIKRSTTDVRVAGILGGIAERFNIDSKVLRITYLIGLLFAGGLLIPGYFILMLLIPKNQTSYRTVRFGGMDFNQMNFGGQRMKRPRKEAKHVDDWSDF